MGKGTMLGIDIGYDRVKLALVKGGTVRRSAVVPVPDKLVQNGEITSPEMMSELIKNAMHANRIRCRNAAVVLSGEGVYLKNVSMPLMTPQQLAINLPYEFRDYITEDLAKYVYDYAMISTPDQMLAAAEAEAAAGAKLAPGEEISEARAYMDLTGAAVSKQRLEDLKYMLRKAGLRLKAAAPAVSALGAVLKNEKQVCCLIDLGHQESRLYMFKDGHYDVARSVDLGIGQAQEEVAARYGVDIHLARTYLETDYEGCQRMEACADVWNRIALEVMRALNFYRFSNPDCELKNVLVCGGGALIPSLLEEISQTAEVAVLSAGSLLKTGKNVSDPVSDLVPAFGITQV